jgi:hypothetical protein
MRMTSKGNSVDSSGNVPAEGQLYGATMLDQGTTDGKVNRARGPFCCRFRIARRD